MNQTPSPMQTIIEILKAGVCMLPAAAWIAMSKFSVLSFIISVVLLILGDAVNKRLGSEPGFFTNLISIVLAMLIVLPILAALDLIDSIKLPF